MRQPLLFLFPKEGRRDPEGASCRFFKIPLLQLQWTRSAAFHAALSGIQLYDCMNKREFQPVWPTVGLPRWLEACWLFPGQPLETSGPPNSPGDRRTTALAGSARSASAICHSQSAFPHSATHIRIPCAYRRSLLATPRGSNVTPSSVRCFLARSKAFFSPCWAMENLAERRRPS